MKQIAYIILLLVLTSQIVFSQIKFVENKGQWPKQVEFRADFQFAQIYFEKNTFTYNIVNSADIPVSAAHHKNSRKSDVIHCHSYKMKFLNSNLDADIVKMDKVLTMKTTF